MNQAVSMYDRPEVEKKNVADESRVNVETQTASLASTVPALHATKHLSTELRAVIREGYRLAEVGGELDMLRRVEQERTWIIAWLRADKQESRVCKFLGWSIIKHTKHLTNI